MPPPLWLIKVILTIVVASDVLFIREYWAATKGAWLHDVIGLTIMLEALAFGLTVALIVLSVFFHLSRLDSISISWTEDGLLALVGIIYFWRTVVFHRERNRI